MATNAPLVGRFIDNTRPTATSISTENVSGGMRGVLNTGDKMTFGYSETISPASILAGWSGASTAIQVRLTHAKNGDTLEVWRADGSARVALASKVAPGGDYVPTSGAVFNGTMAQTGATIAVTFGTRISGGVNTVAATGGTITWTPDTNATDLAGNKVTNQLVSAAGPAF